MKNKYNRYVMLTSACLITALIISSAYLSGCSGVSDTIKNAERLKFKLGSVEGFDLAGVKIKNMNSIKDLNIMDGAKLLSGFTSGNMKSKFTVNLIAKIRILREGQRIFFAYQVVRLETIDRQQRGA
ncbi:MAG: hypothetical protein IPG09_16555 [Ignavibacteria bacterium]|nr:hypothetical protein [Ignavibacteria bacterium]